MNKRLICLMLCILMVASLAACNNTEEPREVVTPEPTYATIHFDYGFYSLYVDESNSLEDKVVPIGSVLDLPTPSGVITLNDYCEHVWKRYNPDTNEVLDVYDVTQPIQGDLYLMLSEQGLQYSISYVGLEDWGLQGDYVYTYRYMGESKPLPLPAETREGYYEGLYCIELDTHCIKVPAQSAHQNLTFTAPKPRGHSIRYSSGIDGVAVSEIDNPNPTTYNKTDGILILQPAGYQDKYFRGWLVRLVSTAKTFDVNGEQVTLRDNTYVTYLTYEMICWGQFTLEAQWN